MQKHRQTDIVVVLLISLQNDPPVFEENPNYGGLLENFKRNNLY